MKRIVLATSSSGLASLNVVHKAELIPLHIHFGMQSFLDDGVQIDPARLSQLMQDAPKTIASTTPLNEVALGEIFARLYRQNYTDVFVCCVSSKFSQNYELLMRQKAKYKGEMNIYIYDTKTLNLGEAVLAYEADFLVQAGATFDEIVKRLDELRACQSFCFSLESLDYIIRNKKLSETAGFVANLFEIRPIMEITQEGLIVPKDKVRKFDRTLRQMVRQIDELTKGKERYIYLADGGVSQLTAYCQRIVQEELGGATVPIIAVSSVSLANHGPTGIGIGAFYDKLPRLVQFLPAFGEVV